MSLGLLNCPCCRLPTLSKRSAFEICGVCWWEDDGQDDPHADEVGGGPNGEYSLAAARVNFLAHQHMYDAGKGIDAVERPSGDRVALLTYVRSVLARREILDEARLLSLLQATAP
jgi:hypothetical protein